MLAALPPHLLTLRVDPAKTTVRHDPDELPEVAEDENALPDLFRILPAAPRRAFDLGILSPDPWFHVFVEAPDDVDVLGAVADRARRRLIGVRMPHDVVYVHDFDAPSCPRPLILPAGMGPLFAHDMDELLGEVRSRLPSLQTDTDLVAARQQLSRELKERQRTALQELEGMAKTLGFGIKSVPGGVQAFPILHGKPVSAEQFEILDESTKKVLSDAEEKLSAAIEGAAERVRQSSREVEEAGRAAEEKAASALVAQVAAPLLERYGEPEVREWLDRALEELARSLDELVPPPRRQSSGRHYGKSFGAEEDEGTDPEIATKLQRFAVNVFVSHGPPAPEELPEDVLAALGGDPETLPPIPPVLYEDNPTLANLFGYLERRVHLGALVSDFTRVRAGSLHRASGGVLILRAVDVLSDSLAWDRLKRVLRASAVGHEDPIGPLGLYATTLKPRPCPIDLKVVLIGNHELYATLLDADADFASLFRVKVEIPPVIDRTPEAIRALDAHLVRSANARGWGPLDRSARGRALDYACRLAEHGRKLALCLQPVEETLAFATVFARERVGQGGTAPSDDSPPPTLPPAPGSSNRPPRQVKISGLGWLASEPAERPLVLAEDVDAAWQERRDRTAGAERELREMVLVGEVLLATEGSRIGVVNGLSVLSAGDVQFGHPMRITAVVSLGNEGVIDVEREASLGGALHTKGVAILRGLLSHVFGQERPIALRAQIAFEQSYGEVEGDSASSSELYAILSALAELPIDQRIAVTGSVNQLGEVQAIGGVAAKIEGFYDLCLARGLDGRQGVLIPTSCIAHLVLRPDVSQAMADGRFHLWSVDYVTQGIEVLTGVPAGVRDASGRFPADSVFGRVERRLIEIAERMRRAESGDLMGNGGDDDSERGGS